MLSTKPDFHDGIWFICGIPDEKTTVEKSKQGFDKILSFEGICGATGVDKEYVNGDYDYVEAGIEYTQGFDIPHTFGGYSGGGLWQVRLKESTNGTLKPDNYYLSGVIFYQSAVEGEKRHLKCHGRKSIYKNAYDKIVCICFKSTYGG